MESIYWVISRDCNQRCPHCYNDSAPGAPGLDLSQVAQCIRNFPDPDEVAVSRVILSGGEVLVWPDLLFNSLDLLNERYRERTELWIQTNGDLLDGEMLDQLLSRQVSRIDVSSQDRFHQKSTQTLQEPLTRLFRSRDMVHAFDFQSQPGTARYAFWGATESAWIGPIWPRGRASRNGLSRATADDKFCQMWSGAKNFLNYDQPGSEVNVQLSEVYPCCPMTCRPLGDLLKESLIQILERCRADPVFQALNDGRPESMGESLGISRARGRQRTRELGNQCLWCDEFFTKHATNLLSAGSITERGRVDLVQLK